MIRTFKKKLAKKIYEIFGSHENYFLKTNNSLINELNNTIYKHYEDNKFLYLIFGTDISHKSLYINNIKEQTIHLFYDKLLNCDFHYEINYIILIFSIKYTNIN